MAATPGYVVAWPSISLVNTRGTEKVLQRGEKVPGYVTDEVLRQLADLGAVAVPVETALARSRPVARSTDEPKAPTAPPVSPAGDDGGDTGAGDDAESGD